MGKLYDTLTTDLQNWLSAQTVFFVATAPLAGDGCVNCSPKGGDTFRVVGPREVAYLDLTGSGIETAAHLRENGRIVIMFCAFSGPPKILRLHGRGEAVLPDHPDFPRLYALFPPQTGTRAIMRIALTRISDSCGFGVPLMGFTSHRDTLEKWAEKKGEEGLADYRRTHNRVSIDQLPAHKEA